MSYSRYPWYVYLSASDGDPEGQVNFCPPGKPRDDPASYIVAPVEAMRAFLTGWLRNWPARATVDNILDGLERGQFDGWKEAHHGPVAIPPE